MNNLVFRPHRYLSDIHPLFGLWDEASRDLSSQASQWHIAVDIKETPESYIVTADLPGISPTDVDVSTEDNALIIKGERQFEKKDKHENYTHTERVSGQFYRKFTLPKHVDSTQISARVQQGVLEVTVPKKEKNSKQRIDIKVDAA